MQGNASPRDAIFHVNHEKIILAYLQRRPGVVSVDKKVVTFDLPAEFPRTIGRRCSIFIANYIFMVRSVIKEAERIIFRAQNTNRIQRTDAGTLGRRNSEFRAPF